MNLKFGDHDSSGLSLNDLFGSLFMLSIFPKSHGDFKRCLVY